jgi:3-oxoacyl-[acyl-carrier protein] reductase
MKENLLNNKTAVVTGATSGIGKAIAFEFLNEGATVMAVGINQERGLQLLEEASDLGFKDKLFFELCDVSSQQDVDAFFSKFFEQFSSLDVLVNNAGITRDGLLIRMTLDDWKQVLETNLQSCFYTCQHACKKMMKTKQGRIINLSSIIALSGNAGQTNYAASKGGMISFSKSLAREMASRNVLVNCIAPGFIQTEMTEALGEDKIKMTTETIPLKRMGTAEEIARTALFLASDLSSYITGQVIVVDGGLCMA